MRAPRKTSLLIVMVAALASLTSSAYAGGLTDPFYFANQLPYGNAETASIKAPPRGYSMFFVETVGRHGARTLTSSSTEKRALQVWTTASERRALTEVGKSFGSDLRAFRKVEEKIGYGKLTTLGKADWTGIGRRNARNYGKFFKALQTSGEKVAFVTSPVYRTKQSASAMRASLKSAYPNLRFAPDTVDEDRLIIGGNSSTKGKNAIARIRSGVKVRAAAEHVLRRVYTQKYVDSLSDPVGKALDIYNLYSTAPGLKGQTPVTFARYVPLEDARLLGYANDGKSFYRYGPGVSGETSSYKAARPLLDDFFAKLDSRMAGGSKAAVFRLAHGETIMPFAALIKAPGSETQASPSDRFTYSNPWRGYVAGRLGGNLEWVGYRNSSKKVLVTMRYHERPVKFRSSCKPVSNGSYFYTPVELKRCLR